jgi:uncharacterized protein YdaU (DUF1376 family)
MGKDPAFLFYPNDYIGGTMGFTFEEKGAYMELLMMQFNRGHMTEHMIRHTVGYLWDNISGKFIKDEKGLYYNTRLDEEKEKRMKFTESRRNNMSGVNQHTKPKKKPKDNIDHMGGHMSIHMENENKNENKGLNERLKDFEKLTREINNENALLSELEVNKFLNYWTEHNKNAKVFRREKETTWDSKKRLARWALNIKGDGKNKENDWEEDYRRDETPEEALKRVKGELFPDKK